MIEQLKLMSIEKHELAETVAQMRDEVTETRICMKKLILGFEGKALSGIAESTSSNDPTTTADGSSITVPTIPSLFPPVPPQPTSGTIGFNYAAYGPLSQCNKGSESVPIIEGATGKGCVHFYIKMMEEHNGDPPSTIFDSNASAARKKKGKVKKMIDTFSALATKKEKTSLMSSNIPSEVKVSIARGLHNEVAKPFLNDYKHLGIKLNSKLTPQGSAFPNEMVVSNITEYDYQINKVKKDEIATEEREKRREKQESKEHKKKKRRRS